MKEIPPVELKFILHWGEMGVRWGINRTVAQIHALLFVSPEPLDAEQIATTLGVARSNVSNSLRELQNWGIIRVVHIMGDRRDHFEPIKDVWEMFRLILRERKKRELDPTLNLLQECVNDSKSSKTISPHASKRMSELLEFFNTIDTAYENLEKLPTPVLVKALKVSDKLGKLI